MPVTGKAVGAAYLALHQAADRDAVAELKEEILKGGDIESLTPGYQETPLHRAAFAGAHRCVSELLRSKADPNAKRAGGFTPLHLTQTVEVARMLIDHGADREARANVRDPAPFPPSAELLLFATVSPSCRGPNDQNGKVPAEHCAGGPAVQEFIAGYRKKETPEKIRARPPVEIGSPSDIDEEMKRRSRMTRKFTQLREDMAASALRPPAQPLPFTAEEPGADDDDGWEDHGETETAIAGAAEERANDSPPQLDAWLRGHLSTADEPELEPQPGPQPAAVAAENETETEEDTYETDEFEETEEDDVNIPLK